MIKEPFSACFWPWNFNNPVKVKYHKLTGSLTLHKFFYVIWYFAVSQSALFHSPVSNISFQRLLRMVEMMFLDQRRHLYPHKRYNKEDVTPFRTRLFGLAGRWIQIWKKDKKDMKKVQKFGRKTIWPLCPFVGLLAFKASYLYAGAVPCAQKMKIFKKVQQVWMETICGPPGLPGFTFLCRRCRQRTNSMQAVNLC